MGKLLDSLRANSLGIALMLFGVAASLIGPAMGVHAAIYLGIACVLAGIALIIWPLWAAKTRRMVISLRNDLQEFLDEVGEPPPLNMRTPDAEWKSQRDKFTAYENRLTHGFQLRFHSRIREAVHRLGERNIGDAELDFEMGKGNVDYETLKKILDRLSVLISRVSKKV